MAQLNLGVVPAPQGAFHLPFEVHNPSRKNLSFVLSAQQGGLRDAVAQLKWTAGIPGLGNEARVAKLGFLREVCPVPDDIARADQPRMEIEIRAEGRVGLTIAGTLDGVGAALVNLEQRSGDLVVGGLSLLVIGRAA